mgnify:FL=1
MRTIYKNISADGTATILSKYGENGVQGENIIQIRIANHEDTHDNIIKLFLDDGTNQYVIVETVIPPRVTLVLDDGINYDGRVYDLKLTTDDDGGSTALTIIIK